MTLTNVSPTVLLVDESAGSDNLMRSWLETNGYGVRETSNIYEALEDATDMTLGVCPSMILLNLSSTDLASAWVIDSLDEFAKNQNVPFVSLSKNNFAETIADGKQCLVCLDGFESLKSMMQTLLPLHSQMHATA